MNSDFSIDDLCMCARRELGQRHRVYRKLVALGKMSQETANREIRLMAAILDNLENQQSPKLF